MASTANSDVSAEVAQRDVRQRRRAIDGGRTGLAECAGQQEDDLRVKAIVDWAKRSVQVYELTVSEAVTLLEGTERASEPSWISRCSFRPCPSRMVSRIG
jgi:hypothetical protein